MCLGILGGVVYANGIPRLGGVVRLAARSLSQMLCSIVSCIILLRLSFFFCLSSVRLMVWLFCSGLVRTGYWLLAAADGCWFAASLGTVLVI